MIPRIREFATKQLPLTSIRPTRAGYFATTLTSSTGRRGRAVAAWLANLGNEPTRLATRTAAVLLFPAMVR